jgi:hypothetical protein
MQLALKRCKHFELGGDKKTKGAALQFVSLLPCHFIYLVEADVFFACSKCIELSSLFLPVYCTFLSYVDMLHEYERNAKAELDVG